MTRLVVSWVFVVLAAGLGLCYKLWKPEAWPAWNPEDLAVVVVLAVTAAIAAWYANATHELVLATRQGTSASLRCILVLAREPSALVRLYNKGPSVARAVKIWCGEKAGGQLIHGPIGFLDPREHPTGAKFEVPEGETDITITWLNAIGAPESDHFHWMGSAWELLAGN